MRPDMFKVIVERPRRNSTYFSSLRNVYRAAKNFTIDAEGDVVDRYCVNKLPMGASRHTYNYKELNENLSPLLRYLGQQVGRPWNDVFAEICQTINTRSTVQQHVREHIPDFVVTNVFMDDEGRAYTLDRYGAVSEVWPHQLFVHPQTGIVCKSTSISYKKQQRQRKKLEREITRKTLVTIDDKYCLAKLYGIWYRLSLSPLPEDDELVIAFGADISGPLCPRYYNKETNKHASAIRKLATERYGFPVYATEKSSVSRKTLVNFGLVND